MSKKQLLIIGYTWPEPKTTAAGKRMLQLIHFFKEQAYQITFASSATSSHYSYDLKALDIEAVTIKLNSSSFNDLLSTLQPTMVLFDRFLTEEQFGWRVAETLPSAIRVLDTEDLHSLRTARELCFKKNQDFSLEFWLEQDTTKREVASIYRCDLSLIISSYEMELLIKEIKIDSSLLLHLPFQIPELTADAQKKWPLFSEREHFICIGNGKHAPNIDAIKWLKAEIWPGIRQQLPTAELHVHGAYLPQQIEEMHKPQEGFVIKGWAEDVIEVMKKSRVNLAPLRFGAGIKGKLIDAMQAGTPSITTKVGAEGMHAELPWSGTIEDSVSEYIVAVVSMYQNEEEWITAQNNGVVIVNTLYQKDCLDRRFKNKIEQIKDFLTQHRANNFIGSLLMHQSMAGTKFMSKWIEEKNKV